MKSTHFKTPAGTAAQDCSAAVDPADRLSVPITVGSTPAMEHCCGRLGWTALSTLTSETIRCLRSPFPHGRDFCSFGSATMAPLYRSGLAICRVFSRTMNRQISNASGGSLSMSAPTGSSLWKMLWRPITPAPCTGKHWVVSNRNPLPQRGTGHAFASSSPENRLSRY